MSTLHTRAGNYEPEPAYEPSTNELGRMNRRAAEAMAKGFEDYLRRKALPPIPPARTHHANRVEWFQWPMESDVALRAEEKREGA